MCSHEGSGTKCAHRNTSLSDSTEGINEEEADHEEEVAASHRLPADIVFNVAKWYPIGIVAIEDPLVLLIRVQSVHGLKA